MTALKRWLAFSEHPSARIVRTVRRAVLNFSLPAPALLVRPLLAAFLAMRAIYFFILRVFVCEPLFKAYCTRYGRGVRTGVFIHWVQGDGKLILGDNVVVDGKCSFTFAARYAQDPLLEIGSNTIIGHACSFTVGRQIRIGQHCLLADGIHMFDAPGHPTDPLKRKQGAPADLEDVRPVEVQDNVWIGRRATIFPGVTIGEGSVVAMGASVMSDVPPYTLVAGNPARVVRRLSGNNAKNADNHLVEPAPFAQDLDGTSQVVTISPDAGGSLERVMEVLRSMLDSDELRADQDFYDAGVTSIMTLQLLVEVEKQFGVTISEDQFLDARTGEQLAAQIDKLVSLRQSA